MPEDITKTGSTPKSQSQLSPSSTKAAVSGRVSKDKAAQVAEAKARWKALDAELKREQEEDKANKEKRVKANKERETEAFEDQVYSLHYKAQERGNLAFVKKVFEEFLNNAISTNHTKALIKERRKARSLAEAKERETAAKEALANLESDDDAE